MTNKNEQVEGVCECEPVGLTDDTPLSCLRCKGLYPKYKILTTPSPAAQKPNDWKGDLSEYAYLHNDDCCVHFPEDARACDQLATPTDCCGNMETIAFFVSEREAKVRQEERERVQELMSLTIMNRLDLLVDEACTCSRKKIRKLRKDVNEYKILPNNN